MTTATGRSTAPDLYLRLGHPLQRREPALGHASRLAALNGVDLRTLARDMNLDVVGLARGDGIMVGRLSGLRRLGPEEVASLARSTPTYEGKNLTPHVNGEVLPRRSILTTFFRVCPHCVAEDMDAFEGPGVARAWLRLEWIIDAVRACDRHGTLLHDVRPPVQTRGGFDFSATLSSEVLPVLDRLRREAAASPDVAYQRWIMARLDGVRDPANWLDDVPMDAAMDFCEALGVSALHPVTTRPMHLDAIAFGVASEAGFRIASHGELSLHATLDRLVKDADRKVRGSVGFLKTYGHVYRLLQEDGRRDLEKFRRVVRSHAFANLAISPASTFLGGKLEVRRFHTLRSAAQTAGRTDRGLRRLFEHRAGAAGSESEGRFVVTADVMDEVVSGLEGYLNTKEVAGATGFDIRLIDALVEAGHLRALPIELRLAGDYNRFLRSDVQAFVDRLFRDAVPTRLGPGRQMPVARARRLARCRASAILGYILAGQLRWVGRDGADARYENLLVDVDEVIALNRSLAARQGLLRDEAKDYLYASSRAVIGKLVEAVLLVETEEFCARSTRTVRIIPRNTIESFVSEHVFIREILLRNRITVSAAQCRLSDAGVAPLDRPRGIGLYRRAEVVACGLLKAGDPDRRSWPTHPIPFSEGRGPDTHPTPSGVSQDRT
ncbi:MULTISPECIES: TniQ family protein [unclassified Methylobacterium]|uniref:TniQ family protein n=1 Tax=unclassified Methylobacterium TaxID=2615210 RepID=UPI002269E532|nr:MULTISPECIES: TniQ family protein [unclassified Methylobacterium]